MQISAANLLIASQQSQAPAAQPKQTASFASALKADKALVVKEEFEALPLKKVEGPSPAASLASEPKADAYASGGRPGSQLDIRI